MTFYAHWRDVPATAWRRSNFSPAEIACRVTGKLLVASGRVQRVRFLSALRFHPH